MDDTRVIARLPSGRLLLVGALTSILAACQSLPPSSSSGPHPGAGKEKTVSKPAPHGDRAQQGIYAFLAAEMAMQEGQLGTAADWYARTARITGHSALFEHAVEAALQAQKGKKAESYASQWRKEAPDQPGPLFALARARLLQNQEGKALEAMEALVKKFPRSDHLYLEAGERMAQAGGVSSAVQVLRQTAEGNPHNAAAQLAYGHLLARLDQQEEAAKYLRRALKLRPDWEAAAVELARTRKVSEGMEILRRFIADHPEAHRARLHYAQALLATGQSAGAEKVYEALVQKGSATTPELMGLGLARIQQEEWKGARTTLQRVLKQDPGNNEALFYLGQVSEALNDHSAAADYYSRVSGGKYLEQARMQEAVVAVKMGDLQRALQLIREMRSFHPDEPEYYRLEARILSEMDQFKAAEQVATQGLQADPGNKDLLYTRAFVREQRGDYTGMEADIREVIQDHPKEARAYNFLGYSLADRGVRLREALHLIQQANKLEPGQGYILDSLGWVYFRLGRLHKAESYIRQALEKSDQDAEVLAHLGEVLEAQGRKGEAQQAWRKALKRADQGSPLARELRRRLDGQGS
ncbi:MAG TPA: tetratricopeptide repeat protein [Gammaproteobacteria bacterium]|nr:tetratricopeptide repeat protein [Gammaproteobacteria bacterium]